MNGLSKATPLQSADKIHNFLTSPVYCVVVMALSALGHILSLELAVFLIFAVIFVYVCVFGKDLLGLMPLFLVFYITPSALNNPGRNPQSSFYGAGSVILTVIGISVAGAILFRVIRDRKRFFSKKSKCLSGLLLLAGAYLLSGIGSAAYPQYLKNNLLFALMQAGCLVLPYWLFSRGVDWENTRRDYFAWMGFAAGGVMVVEILWSYCTQNVIIDGIIRRENMYVGWGMYNNMGFMLALMIPFAFYLATKYRRGWIGTVTGTFFLICVFLSCSRSSILGGTMAYALCVLIMLLYAKNRRHNTFALAIAVGVVTLSLLLFHNQIYRLFSALLGRGLDPNTRDTIYKEGLKLFGENPIFGVSFFSPGFQPWNFSNSASVNSLIPPRWHNTVVQLLASCGAVGLLAYGAHRVQTIKMLLSRKHKEQVFIGCSLLVMIFCSLFDCHFFNLGPTLFYSMALAFAECSREPRNI